MDLVGLAAAGGAALGEKLDLLFMQTMGDVGDSAVEYVTD
jgi:hypothetical protein